MRAEYSFKSKEGLKDRVEVSPESKKKDKELDRKQERKDKIRGSIWEAQYL